MKQLNEIEVELKQFFPALHSVNRNNVFTVPEGYFENISEMVLAEIRTEQNKLVWGRKQTFQIPENYFETTVNNVLMKVRAQQTSPEGEVAEELSSIAPLLNEIKRRNVYSVPEGYFDRINYTASVQTSAKVVPLRPKRNWKQYLIAACVLFVIASGTYLYTDLKTPYVSTNFNIEKSLQNVNDQDIISYLQDDRDAGTEVNSSNQDFDFQSLIKNVSDQEIRNYLDDAEGSGEKNIKGI